MRALGDRIGVDGDHHAHQAGQRGGRRAEKKIELVPGLQRLAHGRDILPARPPLRAEGPLRRVSRSGQSVRLIHSGRYTMKFMILTQFLLASMFAGPASAQTASNDGYPPDLPPHTVNNPSPLPSHSVQSP